MGQEKKKQTGVFFFLPFLNSAYFHKKKCHSWRNHSFIYIFIFLLKKTYNSLPKGDPSLRRTGPQPRKSSCSSYIWTAHKAMDRQGRGSRFLPDLSIRGSLGKQELLLLFANRFPPTGREADLREAAYHWELQWLACQAILRMVIIPTPKPQV